MPIMLAQEKQVEFLAKESERISADIRHLETMTDRFIGFGFTIIGAGFAYGLGAKADEIFFVLPVGLLGIFFIYLDRLRSMQWLGAYKRAIEDKINRLSETQISRWEFLVQEHRGRGDVIVISTYFVYLLVLCGVVGFSLYKIHDLYGVRASLPFFALLTLMLGLLALSVKRWLKAYDLAYGLSGSTLNSTQPTE